MHFLTMSAYPHILKKKKKKKKKKLIGSVVHHQCYINWSSAPHPSYIQFTHTYSQFSNMSADTHTHMQTHRNTDTQTHRRARARTHARTHARKHARRQAGTHARTHTHTHTHSNLCPTARVPSKTPLLVTLQSKVDHYMATRSL